jgi:hypothetical protein
MLTNPVPLILLCTLIGFAIGALVSYLTYRGGSGAVKKELELLRQRDRQLRDLVGFYRERASRKLMVVLGGKPFPSPKPLNDAQRQQLLADGREFLAWLGGEPAMDASAQPGAPAQAPAPAPQAAAGPALVTPPPTAAQASAGMPPAGPLPAHTGNTGPLPMHTGTTGPLPAILGVEEKKVEKPKSIVEQINDIMQEMMHGTPLENKGVRLVEDPRKGVVVWIGLEPFAGVDAVTDPQVKEALRAAANEWERRMERNRR